MGPGLQGQLGAHQASHACVEAGGSTVHMVGNKVVKASEFRILTKAEGGGDLAPGGSAKNVRYNQLACVGWGVVQWDYAKAQLMQPYGTGPQHLNQAAVAAEHLGRACSGVRAVSNAPPRSLGLLHGKGRLEAVDTRLDVGAQRTDFTRSDSQVRR